jgi:hypothetical protein
MRTHSAVRAITTAGIAEIHLDNPMWSGELRVRQSKTTPSAAEAMFAIPGMAHGEAKYVSDSHAA